MTDNEIIKALEHCMNGLCGDCAFADDKGFCPSLDALILDLINRQKAEIERFTFTYDIKGIKAKAIKEFAERLKNKLTSCSKTIDGKSEYLICDFDIDNLVKEMVGDV